MSIENDFNAARKAQLNALLSAESGARIFTILAGGFPADEMIQGAFLAVAQSLSSDRIVVLKQLINDPAQCREVLAHANQAHRHKNKPPYDLERAIEMPSRLAVKVIEQAEQFSPYVAALPQILNGFDISDLRKSKITINVALKNVLRGRAR